MMDFGAEPEHRSDSRTGRKRLLLSLLLITLIVALAATFYIKGRAADPLPADISKQLSFRSIYPTSQAGKITGPGYTYLASQKTLSFTVSTAGTSVVFTEQPAPSSVGSGSQVYYQALGLHPYAQFVSKLGPVALVKFYHTGTLTPAGQSGILAADGTLLTAHSEKNLTNEQWKDLFNSLKISK